MKTRASRFAMLFIVTAAMPVAMSGLAAPSAAQSDRPVRAGAPPAPTPQRYVEPTPTITFVPDTPAVRALHEATQRGDLAGAEKAFADGADANATAQYHWSEKGVEKYQLNPLCRFISSRAGEPEDRARAVALFRAYLNHGLNLEARDARQETPLFWAFLLDDALVREIATRGADVNAISQSEFGGGNVVNAVFQNAYRGKDENVLPLLRFFLDKGVSPNVYNTEGQTPLHQAAFLGLARSITLLLAHGADPQAKTRARSPQPPGSGRPIPAGRTPIQMAAMLGNGDTMRLLAEVTPNLSAVDAATAGAANALRRALDQGKVFANDKNDEAVPLLTLAVRSGDAATVRLLLSRGANVNARDRFGRTALYEAASLDQTEAARLLLAYHADPNITRPSYYASSPSAYETDTPLFAAIAAPSPGVVALLLKRGVTVIAAHPGDVLAAAVSHAGSISLRLSKDPKRVLRGQARLDAQASVLEQIAAKINVPKYGGSALALAARQAQWGVAQALLDRKADVNAFRPPDGSVLMLTVHRIGIRRNDAMPDSLMMQNQNRSPKEKQELRAEVAVDDKEGMAFLRELLRRRPDVNAARAMPNFEDEGRTALAVARFWKMPDVEALLKKAGARR